MVMYAHCIRFVKKKSMIKMNVMMNLGMGKCAYDDYGRCDTY